MRKFLKEMGVEELNYSSELKLVVDVEDLEKFITDLYQIEPTELGWRKFEIHMDMGLGNDESFEVDTSEEIFDFELEDYYKWLELMANPETDRPENNLYTPIIMKVLATLGLIENGNYLIHISW